MKVTAKKQKEVAIAPEGVFFARCIRIIDLGTQTVNFEGSSSEKRQIQFSFELLSEKHVFDPEIGEQPFIVHSKTLTLSLHRKSALRSLLESWSGKKIPETGEVDIDSFLGKECQVQVVHNEYNGNTYANISGVLSVAKGMKVPPAENEALMISLEPDEFKQDAFEKLPEWLREKISASPEYQALL